MKPNFKNREPENIDFSANTTDEIDIDERAVSLPKGKIVQIPLKYLSARKNIRKDFNPDALQELADSIKAKGLQEPIVVYEDPKSKGYYIIKAGERRFRACGLAGLTDADCIIREEPKNEIDRIIYQAIENEQRENVSSEEREQYISELEQLGLSRVDIAKMLHKTKSWVSTACAAHDIRESSPVLKKLAESPSTRTVYEAGKLTQDELNEAVDAATKADAGSQKKVFSNIVQTKIAKKKEVDIKSAVGSLPETKHGNEISDDDVDEQEPADENNAFDMGLDDASGAALVTHDEATIRIETDSNKKVTIHATANAEDREKLEEIIYNFYAERGYVRS